MNKILYCILSLIALLYIVNGYYAQAVTLFVVIGCFIRGKKQVYLYNPYYILLATLISFLLYVRFTALLKINPHYNECCHKR